MLRKRVSEYAAGVYDAAIAFNRNILSALKAINGGLDVDNFDPETVPASVLADKVCGFVKDSRGPALNDRTQANRAAGGWTQGTEFVIGEFSDMPVTINSVEFTLQESANLIATWNGECAIRNTGRFPFKLASITLMLDGEKMPGGRFHFVDRLTTTLDGPWDWNPALFSGAVALDEGDTPANNLDFLQTIQSALVVPPGLHKIEAVLEVSYRNENTGDYYDIARPDTDATVGLSPEDWAGYLEHTLGQDINVHQYRTRTLAVYARQLAVFWSKK